MDFNDQPTPMVLDLTAQGKATSTDENEPGSYDALSQSSQNSLAILVDPSESQPPISPLSTPSPSIRIDDTMSDVSVLSPYTPLMDMSPTSADTLQQSPVRECASPTGISPSTSMLSLNLAAQASARVLNTSVNSCEKPVAKTGYRAKAKDLHFKLSEISHSYEPGLLSPVDAIRQQEVYPLPSPMARDLRRRAEASDEDAEMDITTYEDGYGFDAAASNIDAEHKFAPAEPSCLGLDLGLPASRIDEAAPGLGYVFLGSKAREENEAMGVNRELGVDEFRAQIMQATLAHSASAELVSSPEKPHGRPLDSTQAYEDSIKLPEEPSRMRISPPKPCSKILFPSTLPAKQGLNAYTLATLSQPPAPPNAGDVSLKGSIRRNNPHPSPSGTRLDAGSPTPSPKRKTAQGNTYANQNTIDQMQLRMHGSARFPNHFPKGYLLEAKFAQ
ncbi:hypothetical protein FRC09_020139, partial [Ceratobasidium sp. 395]